MDTKLLTDYGNSTRHLSSPLHVEVDTSLQGPWLAVNVMPRAASLCSVCKLQERLLPSLVLLGLAAPDADLRPKWLTLFKRFHNFSTSCTDYYGRLHCH